MLGASFPLTTEATPMSKTKTLMQDQGIHAVNWYIHTPKCVPSRAGLLTGRYFHNLKMPGPGVQGTEGNFAYTQGHVNLTSVTEGNFAHILQEKAGYTTGMFGKYEECLDGDNITSGWDAWFCRAGGGVYINPTYRIKGILGMQDELISFTSHPSNYSTALIGNASLEWIQTVATQGQPFFAYIALHAPHYPFNPAPWYSEFWDPSWPQHEPRPENWNCSFESRGEHHGYIATEPMITPEASRVITGVFKNRWRTLMSVDDLISDVVAKIDDLGLTDSTYFFFTSDHGFQLGQFNLILEKQQVYEWNTKIHLLARGPGIEPGSSFSSPGTQIDLAPTILGLAGISKPSTMDGHSIVPFLVRRESELLESTRQHLSQLGDLSAYEASWRQEVFIEYYYGHLQGICTSGCPAGEYPLQDSYCADLANNTDCWCSCDADDDGIRYTIEDTTNNYIALRDHRQSSNSLYAEFQTGDLNSADIDFENVDFIEYYNISEDFWQMHNLAKTVPDEKLASLHIRLHNWYTCAGSSCP
jgi:N-acetylglucosamine-6-sulfatase